MIHSKYTGVSEIKKPVNDSSASAITVSKMMEMSDRGVMMAHSSPIVAAQFRARDMTSQNMKNLPDSCCRPTMKITIIDARRANATSMGVVVRVLAA